MLLPVMAGYLSSCLSAMSKLDRTATDSHGTNASCQHIAQAIKDLNEASYLTELAEMKQNTKTLKVRFIANERHISLTFIIFW